MELRGTGACYSEERPEDVKDGLWHRLIIVGRDPYLDNTNLPEYKPPKRQVP